VLPMLTKETLMRYLGCVFVNRFPVGCGGRADVGGGAETVPRPICVGASCWYPLIVSVLPIELRGIVVCGR